MEDGRTPELRRMMVEYGEQFWKQGWAPLYGVLGGNPAGRHAVAALRHLRDGRARAGRHGPRRGRARLDLRRARSALALVYLGEHYVVDLAAGLALAEGVRGPPRRGAPLARAARRARAGARGARRGHERRAPEQTVANRAAARTTTHEDDDRGARVHAAAALLTLCGFLAALDRRALLPAAAARRPRGHVAPDRGRQPVLDAARARCSRSACSAATWRCSAASSCARARADRLARELPDHDGRRWRRRGSSPRAAPAGSCCRPGRCAGPGMRRRVVADKTIALPRPDLLPVRCGA